MTERPTIKISEAQQDGPYIYYRVFVNGVEKPSLVFVGAPDRTVHGEAALKEWCEHNLSRKAGVRQGHGSKSFCWE